MADPILLGVVGSTAYGLDTPQSDRDYLGIFQAPTRALLGLHLPQETHVTKGPDKTLHELGKFVRLALKANPTVLELLFLDAYEVRTPAGNLLIEHRSAFLSQLARQTYGGYARQQVERLRRTGDFESALRARREKHGRHCMRLLLQGRELLATGCLRLRVSAQERERIFAAGRLTNDPAEFHLFFEESLAAFDRTPSCLPAEPDEATVEKVLLYLREFKFRG